MPVPTVNAQNVVLDNGSTGSALAICQMRIILLRSHHGIVHNVS